MAALVLTLIGDDRTGLVNAVATAVSAHGGNWEHSEMSELAGKFAGIVLVSVPDAAVTEFQEALEPLAGLLDVTVQRAVDERVTATEGERWSFRLIGADRSGIVSEITSVLRDADVSIESFTASTREAPMAGERLFEVNASLDMGSAAEVDALRQTLEALASDLMVDIELDPTR